MTKPTATRYCAHCGGEVTPHGPWIERFGEAFCSEGHAEEFVRAVRAARVQAVTRLAVEPPTAGLEQPVGAGERPGPQGWKRYLTLGACCAVPLLALVVLAGGGGALLGAAGALLPTLALLACPLAMYLMMRAMQHGGMRHERNARQEAGDVPSRSVGSGPSASEPAAADPEAPPPAASDSRFMR